MVERERAKHKQKLNTESFSYDIDHTTGCVILNKKIEKDQQHTYLIEKIWVDPLENRNVVGYDPIGYFFGTEDKIKEYCDKNGRMYTRNDCWQIGQDKELPELKYTKLKQLI